MDTSVRNIHDQTLLVTLTDIGELYFSLKLTFNDKSNWRNLSKMILPSFLYFFLFNMLIYVMYIILSYVIYIIDITFWNNLKLKLIILKAFVMLLDKRKIWGINPSTEDTKLWLFLDNVLVYIENEKESMWGNFISNR